MLSLQPLLLSLSVLVGLLLVDLRLVLVAILSLVEADLNGDQVALHPCNHVLV